MHCCPVAAGPAVYLGDPSKDGTCGAQDASREQVERMEHKCAVCWAEMGTPLERAQRRLLGAGAAYVGRGRIGDEVAGEAPPGKALPCGHAFHEACIQRWLAQCHGRVPSRFLLPHRCLLLLITADSLSVDNAALHRRIDCRGVVHLWEQSQEGFLLLPDAWALF